MRQRVLRMHLDKLRHPPDDLFRHFDRYAIHLDQEQKRPMIRWIEVGGLAQGPDRPIILHWRILGDAETDLEWRGARELLQAVIEELDRLGIVAGFDQQIAETQEMLFARLDLSGLMICGGG